MRTAQEINGSTGVLGLIGNPVKHTLSPVIHNTISEELGQNLKYLPFPVEEGVTAAVNGAYHLGILGLNVTVPHKTAVIDALAKIDDAAKMIGAVNTLVRVDGGYKGYNTDMPGLGRALKRRGISLRNQQVVILGAGGASRAACALALTEGAKEIYLLNRTKERAVKLAEELTEKYRALGSDTNSTGDRSSMKQDTPCRIVPLAASEYTKVPKCPSLFIQCTALGLHEGDGLLVEDDDFYHLAEYGFDLVYNPAVTPFMKKLDSFGIPNDNGLAMLLYQGIIAYELWTGVTIPDALADRVMVRLERLLYGGNLILTGYMGCGKSTVGQALAKSRGMNFLDTDAMIEEAEDCSIREIFEERGEAAFRDMETDLLRRLFATAVNTVIATGGGIVLRPENRRLMQDTGRVIWLSASPEETLNRVKHDTGRPLLDSASEAELAGKIDRMLRERGPAYQAAAECVVKTDGKSVEEITEEIIEEVINEIS